MENNLEQPINQQSLAQQPINQQSPVSKTPSGNKSKWILLIIVFLILAFGGGTYYLGLKQSKQTIPTPTIVQSTLTPAPDPTANWKTYISKSYNFSIDYPSAWKMLENENGVVFDAPGKYGSTVEPLVYYVYAKELENPEKLSFEAIATKNLPQDLKDAFVYEKKSLSNLVLYETESLPSQSGCRFSFVTKNNLSYIEVSLCPFDAKEPFTKQEEYLSIYNQMLSTFKFTN